MTFLGYLVVVEIQMQDYAQTGLCRTVSVCPPRGDSSHITMLGIDGCGHVYVRETVSLSTRTPALFLQLHCFADTCVHGTTKIATMCAAVPRSLL